MPTKRSRRFVGINHPIPTLVPLSGIVPIRYYALHSTYETDLLSFLRHFVLIIQLRYYALRKINYERIMIGIVFPAKFIISMIYESGFYLIQQKRRY